MTIVAMSRLFAPFSTLIFAYIFLSEKTSCLEFIGVVVTVLGALLVILGQTYETSD